MSDIDAGRTAAQVEQLAVRWLKGMRSADAEGVSGDPQAFDDLQALAYEQPDLAWSVILRVLELAESEDEMIVVGAGPLETLLREHPGAFTRRVWANAQVNDRFRRALMSIHPHGEIVDVVKRLQQ